MKNGSMLAVLGTVEIEAGEISPEEFINRAREAGARLWNISAVGGKVQCKTDIFSYNRLVAVQKQTGCTLTVLKKSGLCVLARTVWLRKLLLVGFMGFWLTLYFLSGLVWHIRVEGARTLDEAEILEYVRSLGLEQWASIRDIDLNRMERELTLRFPEIAWVAVERQGTQITIRIVEREADPLQFGVPVDIVAENDGIIIEMKVIQGIPLVEPGMTVAKGDVLISGFKDEKGIVNAAGFVRALVYIEGYGEAAVEERVKVFTGNEFTARYLTLGNKKIALTRRNHRFARFEKVETRRFFRGNPRIPIGLLEQRYREVELQTVRHTPEEARELARERAMLRAHQQLGEHADLLETKVYDITADDVFRVKVVLTAETRIGRQKAQAKGEN
ncbi:MAG: sporulation protein YqfD [Firmicutes bacterium]|nr:sporulation protein YqfD [Bacillota bacterium]HOB34125.1 sporulation protein YqfD [Bacillota bacterium]HPZ90623.1 sporulation protein YqfD [Bacillota bacterium]HQE02241.1 sporulation protein YqfD [Bacillota bacterium]